MKKILIVFIMTFFSTVINAQNSFQDLWKQVHKYEIENLPKSALKEVTTIYNKAKKENNNPQQIKCLIYKSKFTLILEENAQLSVISDFKSHINSSTGITKNVLENILANLYWQYFQQHRWQFYERTKTKEKVDSEDFRTWDLNTLFAEIHCYYKNSLQNNKALKETPIYKYADLIDIKSGSRKLRPTLFDFLAHNALEFYKSNETHITQPAYKFSIDNPNFLSSINDFIKLNITTKDELSLQFNALKIYQELLQFHYKNKNYQALADTDLQRMQFINQYGTFKNKQTVYIKQLKASANTFKNNEISGLYNFELASIYKQLADSHTQENNNEHRFKTKDALVICKEVIKLYPESLGAKKCEGLVSQITQQTLTIKTENYVSSNKASKTLINYKNIDKLYFSIYNITPNQLYELNQIYKEEDRVTFIKELPLAKEYTQNLRNEFDYKNHTTEVIIPALPNGNYLIVANTNKILNTEKLFSHAHFQATNIVLVENDNFSQKAYQVVNRTNGKPIKNAIVHLKNLKRRHGKSINKKLTTDKNGFAFFENKKQYNNIEITVTTKNETAIFGDFHLYEPYNNTPRINSDYQITPFIFTDRSIYRPGQTVYFKTIFIKKLNDKSELFKNEWINITLENPNGEEVKTLDLKLNEFGSAAGEFILPSTGLTGEYSFTFDESEKTPSKFYNEEDYDFYEYGNHRISVEEYKRPTFEAKFNAVKESFKINDSIKVNGIAKAYSGSTITDAKVVYRVHRKVRYPNWWYWYRPYQNSSPQEITHGETVTDNHGNFEITFKAIPDETVNKSDLPVFTYEVTADITDINGETRSTNTNVKIGYHSLEATITIANKISTENTSEKININTQNLNGEFVAASGILKIYKLQAPQHPIRKRPWKLPDYQDISEAEYRKLFPQDAYTKAETEEQFWKKGKLVLETRVNTANNKEIVLTNSKNWKLGKYVVELEMNDKFGQKVTAKNRFTLYNSKAKQVSDNQFFVQNTNKTAYKIGEKVNLQLGSAVKNMHAIVQVERNHKLTKTMVVHLNNEIKTLKIPVTAADKNGFAIKYYYTALNSFGSGTVNIPIKQEESTIEIITETFRDKLQPNQEETWSFSIKDNKNKGIAAEVLASMYDMSLDQFKNHTWQFNPVTKPQAYTSYNPINTRHSFGTNHGRTFNYQYSKPYNTYQAYDSFNWFGFSMSGNRWAQQSYVRNLKNNQKYERTNYDKVITGIVSDESGPLPGVAVLVKDSNYGTETDFDGRYTIKVKNDDVLIFSFVGMKTVEANSSNAGNIILEADNLLDEVVVTAMGMKKGRNRPDMRKKIALASSVAGVEVMKEADTLGNSVKIRGYAPTNTNNTPIYIVDGKLVKNFDLDDKNITEITVLKGAEATALFGTKAANGVVIITTNEGLENAFAQVKARTKLQETAFFFPQLKTDAKGKVSFNFTSPESLTRWKLQLLAHTPQLQTAIKTLTTVTQKELMVNLNTPRFLREKDTITLSAKISNLADKPLQGHVKLILTDALTGKEISIISNEVTQAFSVDKNNNTSVSWNLNISDGLQAVQYKIVATAGNFSDGEQNVLPVLSNRTLVTETLPMWVRGGETKTFSLDKLKNNTSTSLKHHKLTLEVTSNPVWYAIQSLPYLMEYPYECSEQTFSRYYANTLASHIANSNPRINEVFKLWKNSDALISNLEKNEELKFLLIQETPWVREAQSESEQKKRIALLFDLHKMQNEQDKAINKLTAMQMSNGGFPWFKGSNYANASITLHIVNGFGHLQKLGITTDNKKTTKLTKKALSFLSGKIERQYRKLLDEGEKIKHKKGNKSYLKYLKEKHINHFTLNYLYALTFYSMEKQSPILKEAINYYRTQSINYWNEFSLSGQATIALINYRNDNINVAKKIITSLKENSITSDELGMYWKANQANWHWYDAPIETQAKLIEAFAEIDQDNKTIDNLKMWLLKNKQVNRWETTKATTEAIYALLAYGNEWTKNNDLVAIKVGNTTLEPTKLKHSKLEAGTGYFKTSWNGNDITADKADITLTKKDKGIAWGALYWQYFEDLDKITSAETPLKLSKKIFKKVNSDTGKQLNEITTTTPLNLGDILTVRIVLKTDRAMEFVHLKDMRASGLEPINVLSKYKWQDGLGYYESTRDAATNFFFDYLPKGIYVFEYDVRVNNKGNFSNGISTIQSMYAPEFTSHSKGIRISVE